jgi:transcriptional regulator with XRE-family HTH domain
LTQKALARAGGMYQSTVSKIEVGEYIPTRTTVEALAQALGFREDVLLGAAGYIEVPRATPLEIAVMWHYVQTLETKGGACWRSPT